MKIEQATESDRLAIQRLIEEVASEHVFPTLETAGCAQFIRTLPADIDDIFCSPDKLYLLACEDGAMLGACGFSLYGHLTHLFVRTTAQGQGIGEKLFDAAIKRIAVEEVDLNASLNAIGFYKKLGLVEACPEQSTRGVRYQPMNKKILRRA